MRQRPIINGLTLEQRRLVRDYANCRNETQPVIVIEGVKSPSFEGDYAHYETRTGIRIWHPTAYSKIGWSSMIYKHSTYRLTVGRDWIKAVSEYLESQSPTGSE